MPTIPRVSQNTVSTAVTQGPSASGVVASNQIDQLAAVADQMRKSAAIMEAEEASLSFEKERNNLLFNPDNGYFNTSGKNAYEGSAPLMKSLEDLKKQYKTRLRDPEAISAFERVAANQIQSTSTDVMRHSSRGLAAWETGIAKAGVENSIETGSLFWNNPEKRNVQRELGRQSIMDVADREGLSPEGRAERLQNYESTFAKSIIESAAGRDIDEAEKLYDQMKGRIESEPERQAIEALFAKKKEQIKIKNTAAYVNTRATELVAVYGDLSAAREQGQAEINSETDPEIRKELTKEFEYLMKQRDSSQSEKLGNYFQDAEASLLAGGSVAQFQQGQPEMWQEMTPAQQKKLIEIERSGAVETDYSKMSDLLLMPKAELANINPADHFDSIAKGDRAKLISAVKAARTGDDTIDSQVARTRTAQTKDMVKNLFGDTKKQDIGKVNQFYQLLDAQVKQLEDVKGSTLSSDEYTNVLNGFARKAVVENRFLPGNSEYDIEEVLSSIKPIKNVTSQQQLDEIITQLRQQGATINTRNIMSASKQLQKFYKGQE